MTTKLQLPRPYPRERISAYECGFDVHGKPLTGRYVTGWYGSFSPMRLGDELMPKLAESTRKNYSFPFLITFHQLENEATAVIISSPKKRRLKLSEIFKRRERKTPRASVAVVLSPTEFKLSS